MSKESKSRSIFQGRLHEVELTITNYNFTQLDEVSLQLPRAQTDTRKEKGNLMPIDTLVKENLKYYLNNKF